MKTGQRNKGTLPVSLNFPLLSSSVQTVLCRCASVRACRECVFSPGRVLVALRRGVPLGVSAMRTRQRFFFVYNSELKGPRTVDAKKSMQRHICSK